MKSTASVTFVLIYIYDLFQAPFNAVKYTLSGDDAGPQYFKINENTGQITVKSDLRAENVDFYNVSLDKSGAPIHRYQCCLSVHELVNIFTVV